MSSSLHLAVQSNRVELVKLLTKLKADINMFDKVRELVVHDYHIAMLCFNYFWLLQEAS